MESLSKWVADRGHELKGQYRDAASGHAPVLHCPTGLRRLDAAGLLELGVCTVVLGHEGDGKSAFGLQLIEGCAKAGYRAQGYWPEDPRRFLADRLLAQAVGESASKLRRLKVEGDDVPARIQAAVEQADEWARRVDVCDERLESGALVDRIKKNWTPETRLALIDYAQVLTAEQNEASVERVITKVVWDLNEFAKTVNGSVVLLSQVRTKVKERGRDTFDAWRRRNTGTITSDAVEGYRPLAGDGQWAPGALGQKARAVLSWFRPGSWMKMHGADTKDDSAELLILKSNYGPAMDTLRLHWHGPTTRITDPKG